MDRVEMMRINERVVRKDGGGGGGGGSSTSPYLDRSKVRILLCDNDPKSSREAFTLLCKCSYQVTSVRTPRQVIDALNAEGRDIDIILAEVDLPVAKGLKMLKYITRDEGLRRIPIIMMSAQDDVSVVVKCLKLGAADYLVKPLRTNELLNLWTHMWRRRHMLGLSEKKILNHDFDVVASDPSDANTNSTTLFSDDTDEKSRRSTILENSISDRREDEFNAAASVEPALNSSLGYVPGSSGCHPCVLGPSEQSAHFSSYPKKSELRTGESSAFFTYVKAKIPQGMGCIDEGAPQAGKSSKEQHLIWRKPGGTDTRRGTTRDTLGNYHYVNSYGSSGTCRDTSYAERYRTPLEFHHARISKEEHSSTVLAHVEPQVDASDLPPLAPLPYYMPGMMNQVMLPPPSQVFQGNQHDFQKHAAPSILPPYNYIPHCSNHVPMVTSFPFYPICVQTAQTPPASQFWSSSGGSSSTKAKPDRVERREAALIKFRQKRKDRCFDKKIRYINRKRLAEKRPRVRGQFVRQVNGVDVDLNGQPIIVGDSDEDLEDEEEEFR